MEAAQREGMKPTHINAPTNPCAADFGPASSDKQLFIATLSQEHNRQTRFDEMAKLHGQKVPNGPFPHQRADGDWCTIYFDDPRFQLLYAMRADGNLGIHLDGYRDEYRQRCDRCDVQFAEYKYDPKLCTMVQQRPRLCRIRLVDMLAAIQHEQERRAQKARWLEQKAQAAYHAQERAQRQVSSWSGIQVLTDSANAITPAGPKPAGPLASVVATVVDVASENKRACTKKLQFPPSAPKESDGPDTIEEVVNAAQLARKRFRRHMRRLERLQPKYWKKNGVEPIKLFTAVVNGLGRAGLRDLLIDCAPEDPLRQHELAEKYRARALHDTEIIRKEHMKILQIAENKEQSVVSAVPPSPPKPTPAKKTEKNKDAAPSSDAAKAQQLFGNSSNDEDFEQVPEPPNKRSAARQSKRPRKKQRGRKQGLFEALSKKPTKKVTPTTMAHFDPTFKHKTHYIVSARSKTGYKGIVRDTSRPCTPWRVKYAGSTIKR